MGGPQPEPKYLTYVGTTPTEPPRRRIPCQQCDGNGLVKISIGESTLCSCPMCRGRGGHFEP